MGLLKKLSGMMTPPRAEATGETLDPVGVALAALMVRLAEADGEFDDGERAQIEAALAARFGDGAALLAAGEAAEAASLDNRQFTKALKDAHAHEARGELIEDLWEVVLADGTRDAHEDALMRRLASLLHVNDREVAEARQRVLARS